jgi:aryl-alcohol dehydrogenase-like predicted oxidoreductase
MLKTSKLALGTVQFGLDYGISNTSGITAETEVEEIFNLCFDRGIQTVDTSQMYGSSEKLVGQFNHNRFQIITKINPLKGKFNTQNTIEDSLQKLRVDKLYAVMFNSPESALDNEQVVEELKGLKQTGYIDKVGYSVYRPSDLEKLIERDGLPDIIQIPFSHLDNRFAEIASTLSEKGVEIHSRSTFLQGLFFMNPEELPRFFDPVKEYLKELMEKFPDPAARAGSLLRYVVEQPFVDKVVIGVNNAQQLRDNLSSLNNAARLKKNIREIPEEIVLPFLWK